jgi:hypothetical protein
MNSLCFVSGCLGSMGWLLVQLCLHVLDSGGEVLEQLHLGCKKLLHC